MDLSEKAKFELAMCLVSRALQKLTDCAVTYQDIHSWVRLSNIQVTDRNFYKLISFIDFEPMVKAIQIEAGKNVEQMVAEDLSITIDDVNFFFYDKEWANATVGELAKKIIDFARYKISLSNSMVKTQLERNNGKITFIIDEQKLLLYTGK